MISRYRKFIDDLILEKMINESIVYYSPTFRELLNKMGQNVIANDLISTEGQDLKPDVTFIDIDSSSDGYLTFTTMVNGMKMISAKYGSQSLDKTKDTRTSDYIFQMDIQRGENGVWTKSRMQVKIGKLINKLFTGKYNDKQIEEFVNLFRATLDKTSAQFELVDGNKIDEYYHYGSYKEKSGTLGNSCMCTKGRNTGIFAIYEKNPEVCKLLVLKEDDKVVARALVWKLNSIEIKSTGSTQSGEKIDAKFFMDRQYVIRDSDVVKLRNYAGKQGWAFKAQNNHLNLETIIYKGKELIVNMSVQLNPVGNKERGLYEYRIYPYVDTFRRYDVKNGIMHNDVEKLEKYNQYFLDKTDGRYTIVDSRVVCNHYGTRLNREDAIYSEVMDDWLPRDRVREIKIGRRRGLWPIDYTRIRFEKSLNEWVHQDDTYYSSLYDEYIFIDNAINIITGINSSGRVTSIDYTRKDDTNILMCDVFKGSVWFKEVYTKDTYWRACSGVLKSLMIQDDKGQWVPKEMVMEVYEIKPSNELARIINRTKGKINPFEVDVKYLTEIDAKSLGYDIVGEPQLVDRIVYSESISKFKDMIVVKLRAKIRSIKLEMNKEIKSTSSSIEASPPKASHQTVSLSNLLKKYEKRLSELAVIRKSPSDKNLIIFKRWLGRSYPELKDPLSAYSEEDWKTAYASISKSYDERGQTYPWLT